MLPAGYTIRPLRESDAEALAAAYTRNREHLAPWEPIRPEEFYTVEGQRLEVDRQLGLVIGRLLGAWVLERDGRVVGRMNLTNVVRGALCSGSLGYWVDREHEGRGLARGAVEHACSEALAMGLHRVDASTLVHNVASQRVLAACGFEQIGMAPRFLYIAGQWQDHNLYQRILHDRPPR